MSASSHPVGLAILGATGSVGESTLDVAARHPERFEIHTLTAHRNVDHLARLCARHRARHAVIGDASLEDELRAALLEAGGDAQVSAGPEALCAAVAADEVDVVMAAIVGAAGLAPTLRAARAGKRILLANKEALVVAGELFTREAQAAGTVVVPVDSEHNALFQALPPDAAGSLDAAGVEKLVLTASGGPFLDHSREQLAAVTPEQACAHPNWDMGRKISVDSATLMNKGLEVIEAHWLFGARQDQVDVVVHPQSIVHGLVMMRDGSVLAQLGAPDMRTPIAHALAWPQRLESGVQRLNLVEAGPLEFRAPDLQRFPCLRLAFDALRAGGNAPLVLNAANEIAVEAFLERRLPFLGIAAAVQQVLEACAGAGAGDLDGLLAQDAEARACADEVVRQLMAKHG